MQYLLYILSLPFLYFNYKILVSDIKYKKIPNKYLVWLLALIPFFYIYVFFSFSVSFFVFFLWIIFSLIVSFIIYNFWIWSAWDAKYLLVLALFIPNIWIINFVGNIWFITICYLSLYFIYFYFGKCIFNPKYGISLYKQIFWELKDKFLVYIWKHNENYNFKNAFIKIFNYLIVFLLIFVSIRIFRFYFFDFTFHTEFYKSYESLLKNYLFVIFMLFWAGFFWIYILAKIALNKVTSKYKLKININFYLKIILFIILVSFIIFEYNKNSLELLNYFKKLFSVYLWIYIIFKILKYAYKVAFLIKEQTFIFIQNLKVWDIVDKDYLIQIFWTQSSLWADGNPWILNPNPKNYFLNLKNPIEEEDFKTINNCYEIVNDFHLNKAKTPWFEKLFTIKILNTFAFGPYIFIWFIFTYLFQDLVFETIKNLFYHIIK